MMQCDTKMQCHISGSTKDTPNELCEVDIKDKYGTVLIWSCHGDQHTLRRRHTQYMLTLSHIYAKGNAMCGESQAHSHVHAHKP